MMWPAYRSLAPLRGSIDDTGPITEGVAMALTYTQAKVLGVLVALGAAQARTVRQVCAETQLSQGTVRTVLRRLSYLGLAMGTRQSPPNWRCTVRGRQAFNRAGYRDRIEVTS
ncbi:BlaI/MecI/CopY family transcriptional regulator [Nocardia sp. NPDC004722]